MTALAVCSAKGSPGATTTALALTAALAATRPEPAVLIEADPAGGDLAALIGLPTDPGLVSLAASSRHESTQPEPFSHAQPLPGGGYVLLGSTDPIQATSILTTLCRRLLDVLRHDDTNVVIDGGRFATESPVTRLLRGVDLTLLCLNATVSSVEAIKVRVAEAWHATDERLALVLVGAEHYAPAEIEAATGVTALGTLPRDPKGAAALIGASAARVDRSALVRNARTLIDRIDAASEPESRPAAMF